MLQWERDTAQVTKQTRQFMRRPGKAIGARTAVTSRKRSNSDQVAHAANTWCPSRPGQIWSNLVKHGQTWSTHLHGALVTHKDLRLRGHVLDELLQLLNLAGVPDGHHLGLELAHLQNSKDAMQQTV